MLVSQREIAKRIPDRVRSELLIVPADPIAKAEAISGNKYMKLLFDIWFEFIEPHSEGLPNCVSCLANVLNNFRHMKAALVELEKEYQLLKSLKPE